LNANAQAQMPASLWAATAEPAGAYPALVGEVSADIVIVGGGYTGLSAALHLAEAGTSVVVVEGAEVGWGASGRNGGQVIPGLKYDPAELERMHGSEAAQPLIRTIGSAADLVFDLIARHSIDCGAVRSGWTQAAHSERSLAAYSKRAKDWQSRGVAARVLDAAEVAALTGSKRYIGGWLDPRGGTVHPLAYARGLARAAAKAGAQIFANTPAMKLERSGTGWRVDTRAGSVMASTAILATNAYTDALWPGLRQTVVPVFSLQGATEPLSGAAASSVLAGGQSVSDSFRLLRYFRRSPDGRLLMGTRGPFTDTPGANQATLIRRAIADVYPELAEARISHLWTGRVAMTDDHVPHLHELAPGLLAGLGYNGRGVAMATVLGKLLAERATGKDWSDIGYPAAPMHPIRFHAFNRLGVFAYANAYRLMDRLMP
jgi:glycine/D-amino acid oxidase-like deaminating enzyme